MEPNHRVMDMLPSLVLLAVAAVYLGTSLSYDADDRALPFGISALAVVLVLLDLLSRGDGRFALMLRRILQGQSQKQPTVPGLEGQAGLRHPLKKELAAFGWILAFLGLAVVLGFYVAIPIYVISYLRIYAGKPLLAAAATGLGLTALLYAMFELLLGYSVFGGLISGDFL